MIDIDNVIARYLAETDSQPEGVWFGPGRVNLIGEHTDYNDGFVLPFAIDKRAVVAAGHRNDQLLVLVSMELAERVEISLTNLAPLSPGWSSYLAGVVWTMQQAGYQVGGCNIVLSSDVPLGAGLSSSAAIECATVAALTDLFELNIAPMERAKLAQTAENVYVGAPTGLLDQAASTLCQPGEALFLDCRTLQAENIPLDLARSGLEILVLDTNTPHSHVDGEYQNRRASCDAASALLGVEKLRDITELDLNYLDLSLAKLNDQTMIKRVRHVVSENIRVLESVELARAGKFASIGPVLDASHASMRDDFEITVPSVDLAAAVAKDAGALGARMTGGGFGGCVIALCLEGKGEQIGQEIHHAFLSNGYPLPNWFTVCPAAGAGRLR